MSLISKVLIIYIFIYIHVSNASEFNDVVLVGTIHQESENLKSSHLEEILLKLKPDVILIEHPINWDKGNYIETLKKRKEKGNAPSIESTAILNYFKKSPDVILHAFDIANRNIFYQEEHYFKKENDFFNDFLNYKDESNTPKSHKVIIEQALKAYELKSHFSQLDIKQLNSTTADLIVQNDLNMWHGDGLNEIATSETFIKHSAFIKLMQSFWQERNTSMVSNIEAYAKKYKGRRIVVLTGFEHRSTLKKIINRNNKISVKELSELI